MRPWEPREMIMEVDFQNNNKKIKKAFLQSIISYFMYKYIVD